MPTVPGYAAISIEMRHTLVTRSAFITFGVKPDTSLSTPDQMAAAVRQAANFSGSLTSMIDNSVTMPTIKASFGILGADDAVGLDVISTVGGTALSQSPPPNVSLLIKKSTGFAGRKNRGRFYLPWACNMNVIDEAGKISGASLVPLQGAINTFRIQLGTQKVPMYILHPYPSDAATAPTLVTALTVDPMVGTQRRRLGRP